ncbi:hypothetical protein EDD11_007749 [Mortierella claussenii]|nr:hypothetical protein EDD11_007749 [Mortierella claussenii]
MATEQQPHAKLPLLAVTIPSSPVHASAAAATPRFPSPSSTVPAYPPSFTQQQARTATPTTTHSSRVPAPAGTASVSTPTSGMHSPPLSNTVEEEDMEMSSAAAATKDSTTAVDATSVPGDSLFQTGAPNMNTSSHILNAASYTPQSSVDSQVDGQRSEKIDSVSAPATSAHSAAALTKNESLTANIPALFSHSNGTLAMANEHQREDLRRLQQHQSKEKTIEHVLKQGQILKVSRRLRTRLEYAILKIRRGWSKYTLQEVESLIQPACSPRVTARQIHQTLSRQSSPRMRERKRVKKSHPGYEVSPHQRSSSDPSAEFERDHDIDMSYRPSAPSTPTGRYRSRMPSLSQYKDSELFQPAKSLMEIATSRPDPGYLSPRHSSEHEDNAPSAAQAAETILMLSSPARPSPRMLNPTHSPIGDWNTMPYSPSASSPLVHFQTTASRTPSPETESQVMYNQSAPLYMEDDRNAGTSGALYASKPLKQPYSNLYGMGHEPSSPSPLSTSLFPSPGESVELVKTHSRSSSPTLKRAVRFAAAATNASGSNLAADSIKDKIPGLSGRSEYNSTVDSIYPGSQPGYDDKKESSPSPFATASSPLHNAETYVSHYSNRASTPPLPHAPSSYSESYGSSLGTPATLHGMRTPPPSGGKDVSLSHYALGSSTARRRRDSGMAPAGTTDLSAMMFRRGGAPSSNTSTFNAGSSSHR